MKRIFDFTFSGLGLLLLWPLFLLIAIFIAVDSRGPIFFRQKRVGRYGRLFTILKFRSMTLEEGRQITIGKDSRITRVGGFLRSCKLDELPQLINVLKGDMSLVGPRPEVPRYVELYTQEQRQVLNYRPGVTDPASLKYRSESDLLEKQKDPEQYYINTIMPDKIKMNREYAERATVFSDLRLIVATVCSSFTNRD